MNTEKHSVQQKFYSNQMMIELIHRLMEKKLLSRAQVDDLNLRSALTNETIDQLIIKEGLCDQKEILKILSELSNIPFHTIAEVNISPIAIERVPARIAIRYNIIPLEIKNDIITVGISRVPDQTTADSLRMVLNLVPEFILCPREDIIRSIKYFYGLGAETIDLMDSAHEIPDQIEIESPDVVLDQAEAGVVKFVYQIISEALNMGATDIHIEPFREKVRLRYRIDGVLQNIPVPPQISNLRRSIVSCIKIMANMNIAERRKPHDGRIRVKKGDMNFDLRVSVLPTPHGETVNLRILNAQHMFIDLGNLGLSEEQMRAMEYLIELPHGVIMLTGPTGSGKTTTLYAILSKLNTEDVKIITVEDPIEYQIEGISQIQTHAQIGLTFANILRSILRHDPDIILIGEIRDRETADIAVRAAMTGHLVFSTLHTNDAPSTVTRLIDMGVEPYLIASVLEGAIAQRLVRKVCTSCSVPSLPDFVILEEIRIAFPDEIEHAKFVKGKGCPNCNFTGYKGRLALFEFMIVNDAIRSLIVKERPANEIRQKAMEFGLVTLRRDGWKKVMEGKTTVDEVVRVTRKVESAGGFIA